MSVQSGSSSREWIIDPDGRALELGEGWIPPLKPKFGDIHVIEKLAFTKLEAAYNAIKIENTQVFHKLAWEEKYRHMGLAEIEKLKAEQDELKQRLIAIATAQSTHAMPDTGIRIELLNHEIDTLRRELSEAKMMFERVNKGAHERELIALKERDEALKHFEDARKLRLNTRKSLHVEVL